MEHIQSTIIRVASDGFRVPKVPTWWTSFKEGTFKDFLAEYRKEVGPLKFLLENGGAFY